MYRGGWWESAAEANCDFVTRSRQRTRRPAGVLNFASRSRDGSSSSGRQKKVIIYRYAHAAHYNIRMYHPIKLTIETVALAPAPPVITNSTITREMALASTRSAEREPSAPVTASHERSDISTLITRTLPTHGTTQKIAAAARPRISHALSHIC